MTKYIDAEKLIAEINKRLMSVNLEELGNNGSHRVWAYNDVKNIVSSLQQEQPEYGYLSTTYIHGKKARWNVGDTLAYYLCTSDEEGEIIIGKITKIEFSDEDGWVYTFENESATDSKLIELWDEQSLVEEGAYKIVENGK